MHLHSFPMNMMKGIERKVKAQENRQILPFISSAFASMVHGTLVLESQPSFNIRAAYYWWKRGAKKRAASLSLCLHLPFTWKCVRLTQTSLTCQRAAAGRGVFDL